MPGRRASSVLGPLALTPGPGVPRYKAKAFLPVPAFGAGFGLLSDPATQTPGWSWVDRQAKRLAEGGVGVGGGGSAAAGSPREGWAGDHRRPCASPASWPRPLSAASGR